MDTNFQSQIRGSALWPWDMADSSGFFQQVPRLPAHCRKPAQSGGVRRIRMRKDAEGWTSAAGWRARPAPRAQGPRSGARGAGQAAAARRSAGRGLVSQTPLPRCQATSVHTHRPPHPLGAPPPRQRALRVSGSARPRAVGAHLGQGAVQATPALHLAADPASPTQRSPPPDTSAASPRSPRPAHAQRYYVTAGNEAIGPRARTRLFRSVGCRECVHCRKERGALWLLKM